MQLQQKYLANNNYKSFSLHPTQSLNGMLSWIDASDDPLMYTSSTWLNKKNVKEELIIAHPLERSSR